MPQDGLRSALYRSFVTCDDPKGVVTCRTIRKNKPHKMETQKKQISLRKMKSSLSESFGSPEPQGRAIMASSREEIRSPASFQLMEVSRGAQKLNRMIECWSRGVSFGAQPNDIAKDLLRGAIDLQDSLVMLGKLQEASRYMARLKRRHAAAERPDSGGASRDELKRVIRESLVKQELALPAERASSDSSSCQSSTPSGSVAPPAAKCPNLIAKLMGLEEYPSPPPQAPPEKRLEAPMFDIRGTRPAAPEADPERRSLKEILETLQFKGLLRSHSSERLQPSLNRSSSNAVSNSNPRLLDDGLPIVLIKPLRVPCLEPRERLRSAAEEEDPLYRRKMLRKLRRTEELQPKVIISYRERASRSEKRVRKPEEEVAEEKEIVIAGANASVKSKASRPVKRNEGVEKRAEKIPKVNNVNKKLLDKEIVKRTVPKPEDQGSKILVKTRKPDSESNIAKNPSSRQPSNKPIAAKYTEQNSAYNFSIQKKNSQKKEKPVKKPISAKSVTEEKRVQLSDESDCHEVTIDTIEAPLVILEHQLLKEEDTEISGSEIEERCGYSQSSDRPSTPSLEEATTEIKPGENADTKSSDPEGNLRALLLSHPSFQNRADELFDLNTTESTTPQPSPANGFVESSAKLFLDCANELIRRRSLQDLQADRVRVGKLRRCVSLEALVEEACKGIEALRSYAKLAGESLPGAGDCLYAMLERDMASGGPVNAIWESGWSVGFSSDDTEQVVIDVEKMVLGGLIEEVFA